MAKSNSHDQWMIAFGNNHASKYFARSWTTSIVFCIARGVQINEREEKKAEEEQTRHYDSHEGEWRRRDDVSFSKAAWNYTRRGKRLGRSRRLQLLDDPEG